MIVLHSFDNVMPKYPEFEHSLRREIQSGLKVPIEFYTENLDAERFPNKQHERREVSYLRNKYSDRHIDLIISLSYPALEFISKYRNLLFPGKPVVFALIEKLQAQSLTLQPNVTGVSTDLDFGKTLDVALQLHPDTHHVFVIVGSSAFEQNIFRTFRQAFRRLEGQVEVTYLRDEPLGVLTERMGLLPPHSVIFYYSYLRDGTGHSYESKDSLARICRSANAPVYAPFSSLMGIGIVGGYLTDFEAVSTHAGLMARRILLGEKASNIPIGTLSPGNYVFDWRQLRRWNITEANLPAGSQILHREPSAWESARWHIVGVLSSALVVALLLLVLIASRARRKRTEKALAEQLLFEKLVSDLSATLADLPVSSVDKELKQGLRRVGEFLGVDRVSLLEFEENDQAFRIIGVWAREGITEREGELLAISEYSWLTRSILSGNTVSFSKFQDLPDEASKTKGYCKQHGIKSAAMIPIKLDRSGAGAFSFTAIHVARAWPEEILKQLRVVAEICTNALKIKRADEALLDSEERFQRLSESAPVMVWMSGGDKLCNYFNKTWLEFTGRALQEELGNGWTEGVHRDDLQKCLEVYTQAFEARRNFRMEYRLRRADGEYRWITDTGVPIFKPNGSFAGYIGSCIDITELKQAQVTLQEIGSRMIRAQENERRRIARELHDGVSQRLALVAIDLEQLAQVPPSSKAELEKKVQALWSQIQEVSTDIHRLSRLLHPSRLEVLGLVAAVRSLCHEVGERRDLKVHFKSENIPKDLPQDLALCLYRVVQESLQNVVKHSRSPRAEVSLAADVETIRMWVTDFGAGFDVEMAGTHGGIGLASMRERLRAAGGGIEIFSKPGHGTRIEVRAPLTHRADQPGPSRAYLTEAKLDL